MDNILTDREYATVLDALTMTRDRLREQGLTGDDCQAAYAKLARGCTPATYGIEFRLITRADITPQFRLVNARGVLAFEGNAESVILALGLPPENVPYDAPILNDWDVDDTRIVYDVDNDPLILIRTK